MYFFILLVLNYNIWLSIVFAEKKFKLADGVMPEQGSKVRCGSCSEVWFYHPDKGNNPINQDTTPKEEQDLDRKQ